MQGEGIIRMEKGWSEGRPGIRTNGEEVFGKDREG